MTLPESMRSMAVSRFMTTVSSDDGVAMMATNCQPPEHVHVLVMGVKATPEAKPSAKKGNKLSVKARQALGDVSTIVDGFLYLSGAA